MAFENVYERYLPRAGADETTGAEEGNMPATNSTEIINYSAVVANPPAKKNTAAVDRPAFSPVVGRQALPGAKNISACDEVGKHPAPEDYLSRDAVSAAFGIEQYGLPNVYPAHSQPPPPDFPLQPHLHFQSQQPPLSYPNVYHPYNIGGHGSNLMGLQGLPSLVSNMPKEFETCPGANMGNATTDLRVQQHQKRDVDYADTSNQSGSGGGDRLRNAIWHDEDPLTDFSLRKNDFHTYNLQSPSQQSFESRSYDEFVHQSQVEDDTFQPYASIKQSPVVIKGGKEFDSISGAIDERKSLLESAVTMPPPLASGNANMYRNLFGGGAPGTGYRAGLDSHTTSSNRSGFDSTFLVSTTNEPTFTGNSNSGGGGGGGNVEARSYSPVKDDDIYQSDLSSKSNSPEPIVVNTGQADTDSLFYCILCYRDYKTSEELTSHCSSDLDHLVLAVLDGGADEIWKYPPPPPHRPHEVEMCRSWSPCVGPPHCTEPHSLEERQEWLARWKHRELRNKAGAHLIGRNSPNIDGHRNCLPISNSRVLQTMVSEPTKIANNCYQWKILIQGQNWLNLFGVTTTSSCSWTFKVTHIECTVSSAVFHPHSASWRAPVLRGHRVRQCLLLGSVQITVKAMPPFSPSNSRKWEEQDEQTRLSGKVVLDLGYKQSLFIVLDNPASSSRVGITESDRMLDTASTNPKKETTETAQPPPQKQQVQAGHQHHPMTSPSSNLPQWAVDSDDYSDDLGDLNIEGEDLTLQHVPIEEWGCSLTD